MEGTIRQKYVEAGRIAAQALEHGAALIKPGAIVRDILDSVERFILDNGAGIAFPAQISINEVAAHSCPAEDDDTALKEGDVVKLDVGAHVDGYVGDNAVTVNLGPGDEDKARLVEASRAARDAAVQLVKAGVTPDELGRAIEAEITARGFQPVVNLSGHGLDRFVIHTSPSIPNYPNGDRRPLTAGQVIAIEPFATTGKGKIFSSSHPTLFALVALRPVRSPITRQVLERIKGYHGLPFTTRWLTREFGAKARLTLKELERVGALHAYPPLPEEAKGLVSQSEHTVLVEEDGCRILTLP